jgi:hypothetical protein
LPDVNLPSRSDELNAIGAKLFGQGEIEPARLHFLAALSLEPNHAMALQNLGAALRSLGHYEASESVARRSVTASNGSAFCKSNLGVAQLGLKRYPEALITLRQVAETMPDSGPSWHNLGLVQYMVGRLKEALSSFDKSLKLIPSQKGVESDRALTLLALGRIQEGLRAYEVRWEILGKTRIWDLGLVEWKGEDLEGKSILVHHEQGMGDSLMLSRFLVPLATKGCDITLAVPLELLRLFKYSFGGVMRVVDLEDESLVTDFRFDYHVPMLSLMRHLGVAKPGDCIYPPYLAVPPVEDLPRLPQRRARVGICWASGNHGPALMERRRLVPLPLFLPLTELPDVSVVSLQKGEGEGDVARYGMEGLVFDLTHRLDDFATTAAVISQLDVVISVDSAVAHLAGALGKPCIMLSPYTRCWRWWGLKDQGTGEPWYAHMPIFVQSPNGTWNAAVHTATREVKKMLIARDGQEGISGRHPLPHISSAA